MHSHCIYSIYCIKIYSIYGKINTWYVRKVPGLFEYFKIRSLELNEKVAALCITMPLLIDKSSWKSGISHALYQGFKIRTIRTSAHVQPKNDVDIILFL